MWGISPQINLISGVKSETPSTLNILLLCPSDPRSIIATIAEASIINQKNGSSETLPESELELRFYIVEESTEALARHFLLLHIFFDENVPIKQRAALYLEVFGNSLIQEKTSRYVEDKGTALIDFVLDGKEQSGMENMFDLSLLKQRGLDDLADVFTSWCASKESDMKESRDDILRSFYADRYDCREGAIDWDYHTRIKPYASIIHPIQFREWRLNGKAFEFNGAIYDRDNRSLFVNNSKIRRSHHHARDTEDLPKMDVVTGPYISHGIVTTCDRSSDSFAGGLFEMHHEGTGAEQYRYSASDISLYNVTRFMWQAHTGKAYRMKVKGEVFSGLGAEEHLDAPPRGKDDNPNTSVRVNISIVPVRDARKVLNKKKFHQYFDTIFVSHNASSILQYEALYSLLRNDATMVVETCRFDLTKNESKKQESIKNVRDVVLSNGVRRVEPSASGIDGDALVAFKFRSDDEIASLYNKTQGSSPMKIP